MNAAEYTEQVRIAPGVKLPPAALRYTFSRSGGPGGQHVNKVSTRVTLTVRLDDLAATLPAWALDRLVQHAGRRLARDPDRINLVCARSRSQYANRRACLLKLKEMLVDAMNRPRRRRPTRPPAGAIQKRLDAKKAQARRKADRREDRSPTGD